MNYINYASIYYRSTKYNMSSIRVNLNRIILEHEKHIHLPVETKLLRNKIRALVS